MNQQERTDFVEELLAGVRERIMRSVPKMPESWDGHELRQFVVDKTREAAFGNNKLTVLTHHQYRDYINDIITLNL